VLLVEITVGSTVHYVSNEDLALTRLWKSEISSFSSMRVAMSKTGGWAKPDFGDVAFLPTLFTNDWEPPVSCPIVVKYTNTDEASAVTLFTGTAHLKTIGRGAITYSLYGDDYTTTLSGYTFSTTLTGALSYACGRLGLSLNSSKARSPSPAVSYKTGDVVLLDEMENVCKTLSHYFRIVGSTLYLVDLLAEETPTIITEFDVFPSQYDYPVPYSKFNNGTQSGDYSVNGSRSYGKPYTMKMYHPTGANILTALEDIKTLMENPEATLFFPLENAPTIGQFISLADESLENPKSTTTCIQEIIYDFNNSVAVARGIVTTNLWIDPETWVDTDTWND
jgi:hypothetical protein